MKKKGIATLALAGALAVSMVPAFAASDKTQVGYTAGGNVSGDGRVMVTVPMDVTFTEEGTGISGFDVNVLVWDATNNNWAAPGAGDLLLKKTIDVSVQSTNGFKLLSTGKDGEGEYKYAVDNDGDDQTATANVTLAPTDNAQTDKTAQVIGTFKDAATDGSAAKAVYTLAGTVTMTKTPTPGQTEKAVNFTDTLTYTFTNMD